MLITNKVKHAESPGIHKYSGTKGLYYQTRWIRTMYLPVSVALNTKPMSNGLRIHYC